MGTRVHVRVHVKTSVDLEDKNGCVDQALGTERTQPGKQQTVKRSTGSRLRHAYHTTLHLKDDSQGSFYFYFKMAFMHISPLAGNNELCDYLEKI